MILNSLEAIFQALSNAAVQYLVVGGLAVNAHGYVRNTRDLDLVIGFEPANLIRGLQTLEGIGYQPAVPITPEQFADPSLRAKWRAEKGMLVLKFWSDLHVRTPIDVFVYEPFDFELEWQSALHFELAQGLAVPFIRLEALLEMKRQAGRELDLADIANLRKLRYE
jgi:hypothetical protein